jgi:dTDP-4-dehydrorhamnose 3,5-epimerase
VLNHIILRACAAEPSSLPAGVEIHAIRDHEDERGSFRELYRDSWSAQSSSVQWNMVRSRANVLRGVHAHVRHVDYLTMAVGEMILGLHDPRRGSPTCGRSVLLRLEACDPHLVVIPPGVCHGFYFPDEGTHIYGVSHAWDGTDEFGCAWDETALGLAWPCEAPILSPRDRTAGSYAVLLQTLQAHGVA